MGDYWNDTKVTSKQHDELTEKWEEKHEGWLQGERLVVCGREETELWAIWAIP